jgi:hypothetical protein
MSTSKNNKIILGAIAGCILLVLLTCCCCIVSFFLLMSNPTYRGEFDRSYCQELKQQGVRLQDDPLGICR